MKALELPTDRRLAEFAYSGGDNFCDITDGAGDSEVIGAACRSQDNIADRLANLAVNRAQYDAMVSNVVGRQVVAPPQPWTELAERLFAFQALPNSVRCCRRSAEEDRLRLVMTRAHYGVRRVTAMRVAEKTWEKETAWRDTLALLQQAERLAPPYSAPARFTRIAEQWLSVWRSG